MRVLVTAVGTRGDVQPAVALALELRARGHGVRLCVSPNFVEWAERLGLEARPMGVEMRMPSAGSAGPRRELTPEELRRLQASMPDLVTDQFETVAAAARDCDVIVGANAHQYAAPSIAERFGLGCVTAVYAPVAIPSTDVAPPPLPGQTSDAAPTASIDEQWRNTAKAWNDRALERVNRNRERLGLAPIGDVLDYALGRRTWLAADPALASAPSTPGRSVFQTGAWVLADSRSLPAELQAFLDRGEPPIYVGFGSMPAAPGAARPLLAAARAAGLRLVVSKGWAELELDDAGADCIAIGDVSHDVLFPRVAAVVHHGGAGTTAAAARAGVPQVVTPMFGDQFYWAGRVVELGVGAATPHATTSEERLASALGAALDTVPVARARALASRMGSNGAQIAADRLEADYGN